MTLREPWKEFALVLGTKEIIRLKHLPSRVFLLIPLTLQLQVPLEEVMKHHDADLQQGKDCFPQRQPRALQRAISSPLPSLPSQRATKETELASHHPPLLWPFQGWQTVPGAFWQHWTLGLLSIEQLINGDRGYHLNKRCDHLR